MANIRLNLSGLNPDGNSFYNAFKAPLFDQQDFAKLLYENEINKMKQPYQKELFLQGMETSRLNNEKTALANQLSTAMFPYEVPRTISDMNYKNQMAALAGIKANNPALIAGGAPAEIAAFRMLNNGGGNYGGAPAQGQAPAQRMPPQGQAPGYIPQAPSYVSPELLSGMGNNINLPPMPGQGAQVPFSEMPGLPSTGENTAAPNYGMTPQQFAPQKKYVDQYTIPDLPPVPPALSSGDPSTDQYLSYQRLPPNKKFAIDQQIKRAENEQASYSKMLDEDRTSADMASSQLQTLGNLKENYLKTGMTGPVFGKIMPLEDSRQLTDMYSGMMVLLDLKKKLGSPISDKDIAFAKTLQPNAQMGEEALRQSVDFAMAFWDREAIKYRFDQLARDQGIREPDINNLWNSYTKNESYLDPKTGRINPGLSNWAHYLTDDAAAAVQKNKEYKPPKYDLKTMSEEQFYSLSPLQLEAIKKQMASDNNSKVGGQQ